MDKKEILEKAQVEYADQGDELEQEKYGGNGIAETITFFIMAAGFMIFKAVHGDQIFDYFAAIFYGIGILNIVRFVKLKEIKYIIIGIISILIAIFMTVMFFKSYSLI